MGAPSAIAVPKIVMFDGVCNLCTASVQFIIKRDPKAKFKFASLQSAYARSLLSGYGINNAENELVSIILIENGRVYDRSEAALRIARHLSGPWPALWLFKIVPRFIRDAAYNWIAKRRYRLFGRKDQCMIPSPALKERFIE